MEGLTVTLTYRDIIEITNTMNKSFPKQLRPSQGFLEWNLIDAIKIHKKVDFFKEEVISGQRYNEEVKEKERV